MALRFKYSDVRVDSVCPDMKTAIMNCLKTDAEVCYILVNYTALFSTENIMLDIKNSMNGGNTGGGAKLTGNTQGGADSE